MKRCADSMVNAFKRRTRADKQNRVFEGKVLFQMQIIDGFLWIDCFKSLEKRKGHGTRAFTALCELADRYLVTVRLDPIPYGPDPLRLNEEDLIRFYRRFGFQFSEECQGLPYMERKPQKS